jgi:single-stranded DNA-binding protein
VNRFFLSGRVEDLRHGVSKTTGKPWCSFRLQHDKVNAKGENENAQFPIIAFNVHAWKVINFTDHDFCVEGRMKSRDVTTKTGKTFTVTEGIAEHVEIVRPRDDQEAPPSTPDVADTDDPPPF